MRVIIEKHERRLTVFEGGREVFRCRVALGCEPEGPKQREGDGRTPEGVYTICLVKERGKYGAQPGPVLSGHTGCAGGAFAGGDRPGYVSRCGQGHREGRRPPWGSPLGGEIYIMREEAIATGPRVYRAGRFGHGSSFSPAGPAGGRGDPPLDKLHSNGASAITNAWPRKRGSDSQSSMSGGLEGRRPATSIVAESAQCSVCPSRLIPSGRSAQQPHRADASLRPFRREPGSTVPVPGFGSLAQGFFEGGCAA